VEHEGKVTILLRRLKAHQVHATLPAVVPGIEPVPVLKLGPRLSPAEEVMVPAVFLMKRPFLAEVQVGFVEQRPTVLSKTRLFLAESKANNCQKKEKTNHLEV